MTDYSFHSNTSVLFPDQPVLDRPRLDGLLEEALENVIVMVTAGAGYGKTLGMYSYLQKTGAVILWMQISEQDNLPAHYWENFVSVVSSRNVIMGRALRDLGFPATARQFDAFRGILERFMESGKKYVVVHDDCHLLRAGPVLDLIERTVFTPPYDHSLVMISRTEPPINSVTLLSKGIVATITAEDLRFTREEIADWYRLLGIDMPAGEVAAVWKDTDGWPIAVAALGRELERLEPEKRKYQPWMRERSFRGIEEDAWKTMPPELRVFLVKLSLIEHWPPDLLSDLAPDMKFPGDLERAIPFIRYDSHRHRYRIHNLFIEFLKEKQDMLSDEEKREVYNMTADWCLHSRLHMDAAAYYELGRNYRGLVRIVSSFPRIVPEQNAEFFLALINRLFPLPLEETGAEDALILYYLERTRFLISLERFTEAESASHEAIRIFADMEENPLAARILSANYINLGDIAFYNCLFTRDYDFPWYEKAARYHSADMFQHTVSESNIRSYINPVGYPAGAGDFRKAINAMRVFVPHASRVLNGAYYGMDSLASAEYAWFQGDTARTETSAREALYRARERNQYQIEYRALFFLLRLSLYQGDLAEVREIFKQMDALLEISEYLDRFAIIHIGTSWFNAQIRNIDQIAAWLKPDYYERGLNSLPHATMQTLVKAKCFYTVRRYAAVLHILESPGKKRHDFLLSHLEQTLLRAAALARQSDEEGESPDRALAELEAAWELAAPEGFEMPFIELGEEMNFLAGLALRGNCSIPRDRLLDIRGKSSAYGKKILRIAEYYHGAADGQRAPTLSWRETAVLKAISLGWSRERTAKKMNLSVNTVKAELRSIFSKLGASNRADAVRIAIELGLLQN